MSIDNIKFRPGQVWRAHDGSSHTITGVAEAGVYPVSSMIYNWTLDGMFRNSGPVPHALDLVELIEDAPEPLKEIPPRPADEGFRQRLIVAAVQGFCSGFAASNGSWPDSRDPSHYEVVAEHALSVTDAVIAEIEKRGGVA